MRISSPFKNRMADKLLKNIRMKIRLLSKIRQRLAAFSLAEGLFGVAIMGTVFVSLYSGMASGFQSIKLAQENLRATQIMLEKFEALRLYNWEQINTAGFVPATFSEDFAPTENSPGIRYYGRVTIYNAPITDVYSTDLRAVRVDLMWKSGNVQHNRTFTSFVARYGLQNYIF
jgi:hypothetical protein